VQRWEYRVVSLRDRKYTTALNEYGREGWELVSVVSEAVADAAPERPAGLPLPRSLGRLEAAADHSRRTRVSEGEDRLQVDPVWGPPIGS
jgi:hypothetical protein